MWSFNKRWNLVNMEDNNMEERSLARKQKGEFGNLAQVTWVTYCWVPTAIPSYTKMIKLQPNGIVTKRQFYLEYNKR